MLIRLLITAALVVGGLAAVPARAQDAGLFSPTPLFESIDEVRIGGAFHRAYRKLFPTNPALFNFNHFEDVSFDVLFRSPDIDAFRWIGSPRPELGTTISTTGKESILHLGLTWQAHIFTLPIFVEATLGAALNNGYHNNAPPSAFDLGCPLGFYERVGIGVDLPAEFTASLGYEHTSNWNLCTHNAGLTNIGFRLGKKL